MKILLISDNLKPSIDGLGQRNQQIMMALAQCGHQVSVIYSKADSNISTQFPLIQFYEIPSVPSKTSIEHSINRIFDLFSKKKLYVLHAQISHWKKELNQHLKQNKDYNLILVLPDLHFYPPVFALSEMIIKTPWIIHIPQPYPESCFPMEYKRYHAPKIDKNLKIKMQSAIKQASYISFPSKRVYEWMQKLYPNDHKKFLYLPSPINQIEQNINRIEKTNGKSSFRILYIGSLRDTPDTRRFIEAFIHFTTDALNKNGHIGLDIIGNIDSKLLWKCELAGIHHLIKCHATEYPSIQLLLRETSLLLHIEQNENESLLCPMYLSDYLTSKKHILFFSHEKSETKRLVTEKYPYQGNMMDEDDIYFTLFLAWEEWNRNTMPPIKSDILPELMSSENFNEVIALALKRLKQTIPESVEIN